MRMNLEEKEVFSPNQIPYWLHLIACSVNIYSISNPYNCYGMTSSTDVLKGGGGLPFRWVNKH